MGDYEKRPCTQLPFLTQKQTRWFGSCICSTFVAIFVVTIISLVFFQHDPDPDPIQFFGEEQFIDPTPIQPTVKLLDSEPKIGEIIHIYANITNSTTSADFCIALVKAGDDQKNVPMKVCVQFGNVSRILYTAIWDGQLKANHSGPNPFTPGDKLDLRIRFLDQYIQFFAAQGEVGIFEKIPEIHTAKTLLVQGGVTGIRLITKRGQKYPNPMNASLVLNYTTRMDLMARPLAKFEGGLWNDLIEGTNGTKPTNLRVKRKGGGGHSSGGHGGRGGSGARGGHGGSHSGHSSFHGGSFHATSSYHYHYSYSSSSCCYYGGGSHSSSHPARAKWGSYQYSPVFGGYYQLPSFNLSTASNPHIFTPSSYSYRLVNGTFYVPSYGHGKALSNHSVIDHSKIPRPKRFDILFSKDNINPAFTLSFRYTEETVVLNTWAGAWDEEDRSPSMPIDDWRIFDLTITNEHDGLHIYINRYPFVTFTHKSSLTDSLKYVRIDGDIENDSTPNHPLVYDLKSSPKVGEIIHISAKGTNASITSNNFCVSLIKSVDDEKNVPLKVCVQFGNKSQIVYTATWSGQMKEKHSGPNPFTSGEMLDLRFRFLKQYVQVFADRGEIGIFEKISGVHQVKTLLINGGVTEVELITKTGDVYGNTTNIPMDLDKGTRMDLMARPLSQCGIVKL
ncbi:unnamed protein product, partial [Mesorhabditis belari]|uniref:Galectin n=1 Tax=Mesorhabditis belari TaxID=2138241 RepID=A0AAF3EUU2_9BILA